jgi:hypothetical protein
MPTPPPRRENAAEPEKPPLRPMKRNGRRSRANVKPSPKTSNLDREFRRRAG